MNKELLEQGKKNLAWFNRMSEELQEFFKEIGKRNCVRLCSDGTWENMFEGNPFANHGCYQIKADYNPEPERIEPEIVECKVEFDGFGDLSFDYKSRRDFLLADCVNHKDWYGFRWSDGQLTKASAPSIGFRCFINGNLEWPTHVLMQEAK